MMATAPSAYMPPSLTVQKAFEAGALRGAKMDDGGNGSGGRRGYQGFGLLAPTTPATGRPTFNASILTSRLGS